MEVGIHANVSDESTYKLAQALHQPFNELGDRLKGEYGGPLEHLLISIELLESSANEDGTPRHPFRLQKRVSGRSRFGLPAIPDKFNVGHFSVRPDFALLATLSGQPAILYVLTLIYQATTVLIEKQKKLGNFDVPGFRAKFLDECGNLGYAIAF